MIAIPAIDVRDGACVQLVGGSYDAERVRIADPVAVAAQWRSLGFTRLHVVDLDAATGRGSNADVVAQLLREGTGVQVGGGVRSEQRIAGLLDAGAERIVAGTRALEDHAWLVDVCTSAPGRVIVAMDVKQGQPVVRGWSQPFHREMVELLGDLAALPLAGVLVTSVDVEGQLCGPDVSLISDVLDATALPVIAAGGITTIEDLRTLDALGVAAAVVGMALYTGDMDAARCAEEFG